MQMSFDVFNRDRRVVYQNADRESEPPKRHDVDGLPD